MAKVSKQIEQLFLTLNFTPELLAKTLAEATIQNISFDALIRTAVEKHLRDLMVAREPKEPKEAGSREYARLVLQAHFAEDRNEFLTEDAIRAVGRSRPQ